MQNEKQSSVSRFGPKRGWRESLQVSTHQYTDEHAVITPRCLTVSHTELKAGLSRSVQAVLLDVSPAEQQARPTTTDLQLRETYLPCMVRKD